MERHTPITSTSLSTRQVGEIADRTSVARVAAIADQLGLSRSGAMRRGWHADVVQQAGQAARFAPEYRAARSTERADARAVLARADVGVGTLALLP